MSLKPRVDSVRITICSGKQRAEPKAGDEKIVKGVTMIRQQVILRDPRCGSAYLVSNGRPVWELVVKGSEKDRTYRRNKQ
jgi:hypothetical protein